MQSAVWIFTCLKNIVLVVLGTIIVLRSIFMALDGQEWLLICLVVGGA